MSSRPTTSASAPRTPGAADTELSYEQARAELTDVVHRLEAGGATLEEALGLWERGEALAVICQNWLDGARARLDAARQTVARQPAADQHPSKPSLSQPSPGDGDEA